jgi:hypothetical protein
MGLSLTNKLIDMDERDYKAMNGEVKKERFNDSLLESL